MEYEVESERVIAFRPEIAKLLDSNEAALMFQQLTHWSKYTKNKDGWVYKSASEMFEETNVSERKQRKARDILIEAGWIQAEKKMANGSPTWHYRVLVAINTKVSTSSTGELPRATGKNAVSITKKTHDISLVAKHRENIDRLYKGWLIEMVIGNQQWLVADADSRLSLLDGAKRKVRLTPMREDKLARALDQLDYSFCAKAIKNIAQSSHHRGENDRGWKATLEWLFQKVEKVEEFANR